MARTKVCSACGRELPPNTITCPLCKQINVTSNYGKSNDVKYGTSVKLSDIKAEETKRLSSGPWDYVFGDTLDDDGNITSSGLAIGSSNLLGGEPGAGKSTLALYIASSVAGTCTGDEYVLILTTEESLVSVASRFKRLNLENKDKIRLEDLSKGDKVCWEYVNDLPVKPKLLIIDSTDKLSTDIIVELDNLTRIASIYLGKKLKK